jgi:hypothetical protein
LRETQFVTQRRKGFREERKGSVLGKNCQIPQLPVPTMPPTNRGRLSAWQAFRERERPKRQAAQTIQFSAFMQPPEKNPVSTDHFPQLTVTEQTDNLLIVYRWFASWSVWSVVLGTGILFYAFFIDETVSEYTWRLLENPQQRPWVWTGLAGLWLVVHYVPLAHLLNRTTIRLRHGILTVRHGPLPWPGNRTLPWSSVKQVYVKKRRFPQRNAWTHGSHQLWATRADGPDVCLAGGFTDNELPQFIRTKLTHRLTKRTRKE